MKSFNGVELEVGQRVITNEADEFFTHLVYGTIRSLEKNYVTLDVDSDHYGRTRLAVEIVVLPEDNVCV